MVSLLPDERPGCNCIQEKIPRTSGIDRRLRTIRDAELENSAKIALTGSCFYTDFSRIGRIGNRIK